MASKSFDVTDGLKGFAMDLRPRYLGGRAVRTIRKVATRRHIGAFDHDEVGGRFPIVIAHRAEDYFGNYSRDLVQNMRALGVDAILEDPFSTGGDALAVVLVGVHEFSADEILRLRRDSIVAAIQTEQLLTKQQGGYLRGARQGRHALAVLPLVDAAFDWSRANIAALDSTGITAQHINYGLIEYQEFAHAVSDCAEEYDLVFIGGLGAAGSRRSRILERLSDRFSIYPKTQHWGREKYAALLKSRIALNIHAEPAAIFEAPRFFDVLGAGRTLVSEGVLDPRPFFAGRDFAEVTLGNIESEIERLLGDASARARLGMAGRATAFEHGMERSALTILKALLAAHQRLDVRWRK